MFAVRKRVLPFISVLLCLCLLFSAVSGAAEDPADQTGLIIQKAAYDPAAGTLTVTWTNTGSLPVGSAEVRINPLDAEGNPLTAGGGTVEEIFEEERILHTSVPVPAGQAATAVFKAGAAYPDAVSVELAVDRVVWEEEIPQEDGSVQVNRTVLELPDSRLHWYSAAQQAYISEPAGDPYEMPDAETLAAGAEVRLGFRAVAVPGELAEAYGFGWSGLLVIRVEEDSAADRIGLKAGDLVFGMDETVYDEEPYILSLAAAALSRGEAMTLWVERDGEEWAVEWTPEETESGVPAE